MEIHLKLYNDVIYRMETLAAYISRNVCGVKKVVIFFAAFFILLFSPGCLFTFNSNPRIDQNAFAENPPVKFAVLPFVNKTDNLESSEIARNAFFNAFASMNYQDLEISFIDETLGALSQETDKNPLDIPPEIVAKRLGADALVYGSVDEVSKFYAVLYAHQKVAVTIDIYDARKESVIFSDSIEAFNRTIAPADSILGLLTSIIQTIWHMRRIEKIETYERLGNKMVENIPNISFSQPGRPCYIKNFSIEMPSANLKTGDQIIVNVEAEPRMQASFDIGALHRGLPMTEERPGYYKGRYVIQRGDKARYTLIKMRVGKGKLQDERLGVKHPFIIDAVAPSPPAILSIRTTPKRLYIFLNNSEDLDFDHFVLYKSTNLANGFVEIGQSNEAKFEDDDFSAGEVIHYRATVVDELGNQSLFSPDFVFQVPPQSPIRVETERIARDTILYAYSSPYIISKPLIINEGAALTIEPGAKLVFEKEGGIVVYGNLAANGEEDYPIIMEGKKDWGGIKFQRNNNAAANLSFVQFENAKTAIAVFGSSLNGNNITIKKCAMGIYVSPSAAINIEGSSFIKNETAIHCDSKQAAIHHCDFIKNSVLLNICGKSIPQEESTMENFSYN